jgi:hypothetical protein
MPGRRRRTGSTPPPARAGRERTADPCAAAGRRTSGTRPCLRPGVQPRQPTRIRHPNVIVGVHLPVLSDPAIRRASVETLVRQREVADGDLLEPLDEQPGVRVDPVLVVDLVVAERVGQRTSLVLGGAVGIPPSYSTRRKSWRRPAPANGYGGQSRIPGPRHAAGPAARPAPRRARTPCTDRSTSGRRYATDGEPDSPWSAGQRCAGGQVGERGGQ